MLQGGKSSRLGRTCNRCIDLRCIQSVWGWSFVLSDCTCERLVTKGHDTALGHLQIEIMHCLMMPLPITLERPTPYSWSPALTLALPPHHPAASFTFPVSGGSSTNCGTSSTINPGISLSPLAPTKVSNSASSPNASNSASSSASSTSSGTS